jgi:hypothetical protein
MTQQTDWTKLNDLYCGYMYFAAAESGYDSRAAWAAKEPYLKARMEYEEKYGVAFNPENKPDTTILESAAEMKRLSDEYLQLSDEAKAYSKKLDVHWEDMWARARATRADRGEAE